MNQSTKDKLVKFLNHEWNGDYSAIESFIELEVESVARVEGIEIALKVLNQLREINSITGTP